jgi:hypothetical protein
MRLNVKAFALAGGILWAFCMFTLTWWTMIFSYSISPIGSVIGAVYGFFDAGIGCAIFALLYNLLVGKK